MRYISFIGLDTADPGLVPDGSACPGGNWCQEQQCVSRPEVPEHCNCSNVSQFIKLIKLHHLLLI